ncbi:LOW QUALITY PROTEIN: uncharacterized protein [Populus alba]
MASSSSPTTPYLKHDVFLSFRGTDTRKGFTSHLHHALQRNQIDAYIDNELDGGEKIEPALLERIEESCISLVIFSENYADSTFCLRELSKILECRESKRQMVLPVFYRLDPSHVQNLTGSYGDALCKHERDCSSEEVESWRRALKEIANVKGWDSKEIKDETTLIHEIVTDIQKKLNHELSLSFVAKGLFGMKSRVEDIESLLSFGSTGVLIVGIWGMGGIGKSRTADVVYHRNRSKFEGHCFFQNVREESKKHGVNRVRQEILGEVLEKKDMTIRPIRLPQDIKRMLQRKKVLIVLDDVNDPQDLKYLVGEDGLFGQGSRIIVTSRDRQVLINACDEDKIYEVEILDEDDALRLFSLHAFKQDRPIEGYIGLSKTVVSCVKGIPLVLEVLGGILCNRRSVDYWESKVAQLRTNGGEDIKKHLEMCYHELDQTEKKIFLDIACFFGRCKRDHLQQTLDLEERSGIDRLIDMCLIKIVQNKIWMHDVLVKLGKKIVHQENVDPRDRSRLWEADDIYRVLTTQGTGSKVESISLNLLAITKEMFLSRTTFEGMYNLRLLRIYYPPFLRDPSKEQIMNGKRVGIHLAGGLHFLSSELRFLYWYNYPLKSMPSNFFPKKPFQLEMPCSQLEQLWNEYQPLELPRFESFCTFPSTIRCLSQLVRLNLSSCESLASLPDNIDELKSLVKLNLYSCSKLASLPNSICKLKCLAELNLGGQPKLTSLPDKIGELRSLVKLSLSSCSKLASLPDSIGELRSLVELDLSSCLKLASLPDSIGELRSLVELRLSCPKLASLPDSIGELRSLVKLSLSFCSKLASLPDSIGELRSLVKLSLSYCSKLASLPDSIGELRSLVELDLSSCLKLASLPDSIGELRSLVELDLSSCLKLASLPDSIGELRSLVELDLFSCLKLASLPDSIGELRSLVELDLSSCSKLASLPDSIGELRSLVKLDLSSCSKLASLPDSIGELRSLVKLSLSFCSKLASLPDSIGKLRSLVKLSLSFCSKLASLPDNIGGLKSLQSFDLRNCFGLTSLPDNIDALKSLQWLSLTGCSGLASLPDNIGGLESLESLYLSGRSELASLLDNIGMLKSLKLLDLSGHSELASLLDNIGALKSLKKLELRGCSGLASLPDSIGALKSLEDLNLCGCSGLASLPDNIGALKSLENLNLGSCSGLASLPDSIGALKSLEDLNLCGCSGLASLPDSIDALKSLENLNLGSCSGLASLPDRIGELKSLDDLNLCGCSGLASLPDSISALKSLQNLDLCDCSGLASLPDSIGMLKSLRSLSLNDFLVLTSLPDIIGALKSLESLDLYDCPGLASLPDSIGELKSLQSLDLHGCSGLASLPDSIGELKSLQSLDLHGCSGLASLPDNIGELKSLKSLDLHGCSGLASLPDSIGELKSLTKLILSGCLKLASLPDNFIDLEFRGLDKQPCYMLRGFQKVEEIASSTYKLGCHQFLNLGNSRMLKTIESLGSLVSLTQLRLSKIDFERIPASIKHLTKLSELYLVEACKRLQCLPELPLTLKVLIASGCISLKSVASISMPGDIEYEVASQEFNFSGCLQLDQNSRTRIMSGARLRIQHMATSLFYKAYNYKPFRVQLCIPGSKVPECFSYKNRGGSSVKIQQLAHWHRGFTLCAVVSFGQSEERRPVNIECECHLIIKDGTQIDLSSYYDDKYIAKTRSIIWKREHVFIWSVHSKCFFKEASFHFKPLYGATDVMVECGVHPLLK